MQELVWFVLSAVIGIAVLYYVIKTAVKQAFREMKEEEREAEKAEQDEKEG